MKGIISRNFAPETTREEQNLRNSLNENSPPPGGLLYAHHHKITIRRVIIGLFYE
jgi:hypothetical protein